MAQQISIPKGTRDFGALEMSRRNFIFDTLKTVFKNYGFSQIETPAMENLSTLMGKYGDEGDKLLFKILNSGNYFDSLNETEVKPENIKKITNLISEKGLRYDLTVPFARFVVQHQNEIQFPFKRFQIQPVWRADRPQKGRYREFFQCDVDIIGSKSLFNEFELIQIITDCFNKLNINIIIKINNRKILYGIAEKIGFPKKFVEITVALDKIDKIGKEKVTEELLSNGLTIEAIEHLSPIFEVSNNFSDSILVIEKFLENSEIGKIGVEEIKTVFDYIHVNNIETEIELDLTLARGLNYYTGAIFEVKAKDVEIGSICGGGRYDNLTEIFGLKNISGVGISFGADRIYDVMSQLDIFPKDIQTTTKILFINSGLEEEKICIKLAQKLRNNNISCEIYPEKAKFDKQFKYANNKNIAFVVIIGEEEIKNNNVSIKNMTTGAQEIVSVENFIDYFCLKN
ncbi:MAG: histidine--tRNA ligase [Bacteroidales bacterium]|jgi:histidyl-tRNA synthetase|nr:histidine--tRNA ligase [Bacteroidales bacterium]